MVSQPALELAAPALLGDPTWRESVGNLLRTLGYDVDDRELTRRLGSLLAHPDYRVWCARHEDGLKGLVVAMRVFGLQMAGPIVETTLLAVDPEARGQGLGRALIGRVEDWAQELGASRIKVQSGNDRHEAHRFYGRIGYLASGVRFTKDPR
jgi:GNAT superfamily N-acetyltransferase